MRLEVKSWVKMRVELGLRLKLWLKLSVGLKMKVKGQDCRPPPAPRRRWSRWSPQGGEGLGADCGPWSPPPRGGQGRGRLAWRDPEGDDQEDAHVSGQALDPLKSGGV